MSWAPEGKRRRGRPKTTWRRTVEKDRQEACWRYWCDGADHSYQSRGVEKLCEGPMCHEARKRIGEDSHLMWSKIFITSFTGESAVITRLYLNFLCLPFSIPFGTGEVGFGELGALLNLGGRPLPLFTGNIVIFFILLGLKKIYIY